MIFPQSAFSFHFWAFLPQRNLSQHRSLGKGDKQSLLLTHTGDSKAPLKSLQSIREKHLLRPVWAMSKPRCSSNLPGHFHSGNAHIGSVLALWSKNKKCDPLFLINMLHSSEVSFSKSVRRLLFRLHCFQKDLVTIPVLNTAFSNLGDSHPCLQWDKSMHAHCAMSGNFPSKIHKFGAEFGRFEISPKTL